MLFCSMLIIMTLRWFTLYSTFKIAFFVNRTELYLVFYYILCLLYYRWVCTVYELMAETELVFLEGGGDFILGSSNEQDRSSSGFLLSSAGCRLNEKCLFCTCLFCTQQMYHVDLWNQLQCRKFDYFFFWPNPFQREDSFSSFLFPTSELS